MTDDQINIAIAEKCGWDFVPLPFDSTPEDKAYWRHVKSGNFQDKAPNYISDLNAMHDAEKVIGTSTDWTKEYEKILWHIGNLRGIHATAHQRAEAFLRVFNLWTD